MSTKTVGYKPEFPLPEWKSYSFVKEGTPVSEIITCESTIYPGTLGYIGVDWGTESEDVYGKFKVDCLKGEKWLLKKGDCFTSAYDSSSKLTNDDGKYLGFVETRYK